MKLRNKRTGKIEEVLLTMDKDKIAVIVADMPLCGNSILGEYESLAELNEEWEDYTPTEPLIKDEKIRKAVRAWAEACGIDEHEDEINYDGDWTFWCMVKDCTIDFTDVYAKNEDSLITCNNDVYFTITELCGEEEE